MKNRFVELSNFRYDEKFVCFPLISLFRIKSFYHNILDLNLFDISSQKSKIKEQSRQIYLSIF